MSQEGYADPITNDGPRFHSNMPVSEPTERVARAIEASDVSSAPLVARNRRQGNAQNSTDPYQAQWEFGGSRRPSALVAPGSTTSTCLIPRRARHLDP